jgi:hypothetical protein
VIELAPAGGVLQPLELRRAEEQLAERFVTAIAGGAPSTSACAAESSRTSSWPASSS